MVGLDDLVAGIDAAREELAELCLLLGNTNGPTGNELPTATAVHEWYQREGVSSKLDLLMPGRANTVATISGGDGPSVMFNAHLDTEAPRTSEYDHLLGVPNANEVGAWREGDRIFGHTVLNDRGCMAAMMIAGRALERSGIELNGDVVLVSAAGETGAVPVDEYEGMQFLAKGFGTRSLLERGLRTSFGVIAESTSNAITTFNCGVYYYQMTVRGRLMYTPRMVRGESLGDHPNAVVKAAHLIVALEEWAVGYEESRTRMFEGVEVRPKAQVTTVRGNLPWRPARSAPLASMVIDVRTLPDESPATILDELYAVAESVGVSVQIEPLLLRQGAVADNAEPIIDAVTRAHQRILGKPPSQPSSVDLSMYRDTIPLNEVGIPAIAFGPDRGRASVQGTGHFELDDLVASAKIYTLTALGVTGTTEI
jgi:acetylornithine deacetylase/succinyl-diaminopimelate desuccinylase-like protein